MQGCDAQASPDHPNHQRHADHRTPLLGRSRTDSVPDQRTLHRRRSSEPAPMETPPPADRRVPRRERRPGSGALRRVLAAARRGNGNARRSEHGSAFPPRRTTVGDAYRLRHVLAARHQTAFRHRRTMTVRSESSEQRAQSAADVGGGRETRCHERPASRRLHRG